jgi:hypothetical protein
MHEHTNEAATRSTFECFECGELQTQAARPGTCPECGGEFRNRSHQLV